MKKSLEERAAAMKMRMQQEGKISPTIKLAKKSGRLAGWVYAVRVKDGPVKIGLTFGDDPFGRIKWVEQGSPYPIEIIGLAYSLNVADVEANLHRCFKAKRGKGEWFALDQSDIDSLFSVHGFATVAQAEQVQQEMLMFVCHRAQEYAKKLRGEPYLTTFGEFSS